MGLIINGQGPTGETVEEKITPPASPAENKLSDDSEESTEEELEENGEKPEEKESDEVPEKTDEPEDDSEEEPEESATLDQIKVANALKKQQEKLRSEIVKLRQERRELKHGELAVPESKKEDDLKDLDEEYVKAVERVIKSKGYLTENQLLKNNLEEAKDKWLSKHPELLPGNDKGDVKWGLMMDSYKMYKTPSNPLDLVKILDKAYEDTFGSDATEDKTAENKQKAKSLSRISANGKNSSDVSLKSFNQSDVSELKRGGWSDKEIAEILSGKN